MADQPGKIILLNGASSSGKSTLANLLQGGLSEPFWSYSIDHLKAGEVLPMTRIKSGEFPWQGLRTQFFEGFHRSLPAFAGAGNNLIVEHIVETQEWMNELLWLLEGFDVFFVGVHCPLEELERRERERGNRRIGEAKNDFETIHKFCEYDLEIDSSNHLDRNVHEVIHGWANRQKPSAFDRMRIRSTEV